MMKLDKLIRQFNKPNVHLVISRWPGKGKRARFDGIATYTQDILESFTQEFGAKFVVLAEKAMGEPMFELVGRRILVLRVFDPKKHSLFPRILVWLNQFKRIKRVYVHSEFCASSGLLARALTVPFLGLIRLMGRKITFYAHNVPNHLGEYAAHFDLKEKGWAAKVMEMGVMGYYWLVSLLVERFVVLDKVVEQRLKPLVKKEIVVQPHWIKQKSAVSQVIARRKLGIDTNKSVVLSFGFVTYYKGADWVVRLASNLSQDKRYKQVMLVLAGGRAYSLHDKEYYRCYYDGIKSKALNQDNLVLTGFLANKEIDLWMAAADVVIFPYRGLMGGSGALQTALKYGKRIWMSESMFDALRGSGVCGVLEKAGLKKEEVVFKLETRGFKKLIARLMEKGYKNKLSRFSRGLGKMWAYKELVKSHYQVVYGVWELQPNCSQELIAFLRRGWEYIVVRMGLLVEWSWRKAYAAVADK